MKDGRRNCAGILMLLAVVACCASGIGTIEICRHAGGDAHLFFSGGSCAGLHVDEDGHLDAHDHADESHHCSQQHDHENHHEPCDHDSYSLDNDWSLSANRIVLPSPGKILTLPIAKISSPVALDTKTEDASSCFSRAPPGSMGSSTLYLRTIRLVI